MAKRRPKRRSPKQAASPTATNATGKSSGAERQPSDAPPTAPTSLLDLLTVPRIIAIFVLLEVALIGGFLWQGQARVHNMWAERAMERQDWTAALGNWQWLGRSGPNEPLIHAQMARCLLELGRPEEAVAPLDIAEKGAEAVKRGRSRYLATLQALQGWLLLDVDRTSEGIALLRKALRSEPTLVVAHAVLARHYLAHDDLPKAGDHFRHLADLPEYERDFAAFRERAEREYLAIDESLLAEIPERVAVPGAAAPIATEEPTDPAQE